MPMLICLEGITSVGKSNLLLMLKDHFTALGYRVAIMPKMSTLSLVVRKVDDPDIAFSEVPKDKLANPLLRFVDPIIRSRLFKAGRDADVVLLDRFIYSPLAYHYDLFSTMFGDMDAIVSMYHRLYEIGMPKPDVCFYIDADVDVVAKRYVERPDKSKPLNYSLESQARQRFQELCSKDPNLIQIDSANKNLEEIFQELIPAIESKLPPVPIKG